MLAARHRGVEEQGRPLRDMEICAQAFTLLLGGYETTSTATSLALFLLARHPEAQAQVVAEAEAAGLGAGLPGFDTLVNGLPWTTAVVKETLRLFPVGTPLVALVRVVGVKQFGGQRASTGSDVPVNCDASWRVHHPCWCTCDAQRQRHAHAQRLLSRPPGGPPMNNKISPGLTSVFPGISSTAVPTRCQGGYGC